MNWLVILDDQRKFFAGSTTETKLLAAQDAVRDVSTQDHGYSGHVVTIVSDRYIVDPSFDQAISNLNLQFDLTMKLQPVVLVIGPASEDLPKDFSLLMNEIPAGEGSLAVSYEARADSSFQSTPAWNDLRLDELSDEIWRQMVFELANMGPDHSITGAKP